MVYIDNADKPYKGMIMSHMIADSKEELLCIVRRLGIHTKWIQFEGTYKEHFDICLSKKLKALQMSNVIQVETRQIVQMMLKRKHK